MTIKMTYIDDEKIYMNSYKSVERIYRRSSSTIQGSNLRKQYFRDKDGFGFSCNSIYSITNAA